MSKRAGELTDEEVDRVITIMQNPRQYKIPDWFLNRQKDRKDGKFSQVSHREASCRQQAVGSVVGELSAVKSTRISEQIAQLRL